MTGVWIGTAGWSVPSGFGDGGSQLQRYATRLCCVEINSSFYRPHRPATYARWAASVPAGFRFSVKAPRSITHEARLRDVRTLLAPFLEQASALGAALGPLLIQLPPSLAFDAAVAQAFFGELRDLYSGEAVLEPRHATWFAPEPERLLRAHAIGRVAADPAPIPEAAVPGGALRYWRLHGSPRMYHTPYGEERLRALAAKLAPRRLVRVRQHRVGRGVDGRSFVEGSGGRYRDRTYDPTRVKGVLYR